MRWLVCIVMIPFFGLAQDQPFDCTGLDTLETWQGIRYCIVTPAQLGKTAQKGNHIKVHYTGYLEDGSIFDSSDRSAVPFSFRYQKMEVIRGWDIVMGYLKEGEKARVFIPWKFAYGKQGRPPIIPKKANLVFDIEVISIN